MSEYSEYIDNAFTYGDYQALCDILDLLNSMRSEYDLLNPNHIERFAAKKYSLKAKKMVVDMIRKEGDTDDLNRLFWGYLLFEARIAIVDSYLLYLERNREQKDKFYEPKRTVLIKHGLIQGFQDLLDDKIDMLLISMPPGTGKSQPLTSKVLTPDGWKFMGDIHVGDKVISGTGNVADVIGVYPQGMQKTYKVTFDDGSSCLCSENHLWTVKTREDRRRKKNARTIELKDMLNNFKIEQGKRCNYSLEYVGRINFPKKDFEIDPYVMGAFLGNGSCSSSLIFTSADEDVLNRFNSKLPDGCSLKHKDRYDYSIQGFYGNNTKNGSIFRDKLRKYGIERHKSYEKFIPDDYMFGSYEQRLDLLRGLMDTDGTASGRDATYSSTSLKLASQVVELAHSLGYYASLSNRKSGYKKDGEYIECRMSYNVLIQGYEGCENPFYLRRKAERFAPKRKEIYRFITDIEYVGEEESQCIYISDPSHLYVTDDYIITHNTTLEKFFNSGVIGWFPEDGNIFYSHSGDITRMYFDGVLQMVTDSNEYTWSEIFEGLSVTSQNAKMEQFNVGKYKPFPSLQTGTVGGNSAGKIRASKFLLVDDLIGKMEQALNPAILDKLWNNSYTTDARQRKTVDSYGMPCKEVVICTRWSVGDVIGRLIATYEDSDRVRVISIPDIDPETGKSNFMYDVGGFDEDFFADIEKLMDEISYRCLYKQDPIEREGLLYHPDDFEYFYDLPDAEPDAILGVCDTKDRGSDYCFLPLFYQYGDKYYLEDCVFDNGDLAIVDQKCADLIIRINPHEVQFESNSAGGRTTDAVRDIVKIKMPTNRTNFKKKFTTQNKETKIIVNSTWVKEHIVLRDKSTYNPHSDYSNAMKALFSYTMIGKNPHDDAPDGMAMFAEFVSSMSMAKVTVTQNPFWRKR